METETIASFAESKKNRVEFYLSRLCSITVPLVLGQLLSGLIAATAICSTFLATDNISIPLTQNLLHYLLLTLCYVPVRVFHVMRHRQKTVDSTPANDCTTKAGLRLFGMYVLVAVMDVHANWSIVAAYRFTSVTSVQLLDCVTVPVAMLLSFFCLRYRYLWTHYVAMCVCLLGAGGMLAADVYANPTNTNSSTNSTSPTHTTSDVILGDFLVILGAAAYATSNVLQQYLVTRYGCVRFLAYIGAVSTIPIAVYTVIFERDVLHELFTSSHTNAGLVSGCLIGYVLAMFLLYSLMPYVLAKTSAILVNLSLLTADVYALLVGIYLFHNHFHPLYILSFFVILFGVGLFVVRTPLVRSKSSRCCFGSSTNAPSNSSELVDDFQHRTAT